VIKFDGKCTVNTTWTLVKSNYDVKRNIVNIYTQTLNLDMVVCVDNLSENTLGSLITAARISEHGEWSSSLPLGVPTLVHSTINTDDKTRVRASEVCSSWSDDVVSHNNRSLHPFHAIYGT